MAEEQRRKCRQYAAINQQRVLACSLLAFESQSSVSDCQIWNLGQVRRSIEKDAWTTELIEINISIHMHSIRGARRRSHRSNESLAVSSLNYVFKKANKRAESRNTRVNWSFCISALGASKRFDR